MAYENEYQFTREICPNCGRYNVNDICRNGQLTLADEIKSSLPGKEFLIRANNGTFSVFFDSALTSEEQAILQTTINNHKNNI